MAILWVLSLFLYAAFGSVISCNDSYILVLFSTELETDGLVQDHLCDLQRTPSISVSNLTVVQRRIQGSEKIIYSVRTGHICVEFLNLWRPCQEAKYMFWSDLVHTGVITQHRQVTIVGPSRSDFTHSVAQFVNQGNLLLRHYHASPLPAFIQENARGSFEELIPSAELLANASGSFEGLIPSAELLANASVDLVKYANWSHILAIYQDDDIDFMFAFRNFQRSLNMGEDVRRNSNTQTCISSLTNKVLEASIPTNLDSDIHINAILSYPVKVVFLFLNPRLARSVLCHLKNYSYQFVITKTSYEDILSLEDSHSACSKTDISQALEGVIVVGYNRVGYNSSREYYRDVYRNGILMALDYHTPEMSPLNIVQYTNDQPSLLALYYSNHSLIEINKTVFVSSVFPTEHMLVDSIWFGISLLAALVLALLAVLTHILTILHRNSRSIRATGIKVQQLSMISIYALILALFICCTNNSFYLGSIKPYICTIYFVIASTSVILLLSTLVMHHWRLYRIFKHYLKPGELLSNRYLMIISFLLGIVQAVNTVVWVAIDSPMLTEYSCKINLEKFVVTAIPFCAYNYFHIFQSIFLSYLTVLVVAAFALHALTKQHIPKSQASFQGNNSKYLLYSFVFIFIVGYSAAVIGNILKNMLMYFLASLLTQIFLISALLIFLFLYPLYYAFKEVEQN